MITKRIQNAAHIRYKIINYVSQACQTRDFSKIHVTEICQAANISKVTFFKYFDHKEDVLMLYKTIVCTCRIIKKLRDNRACMATSPCQQARRQKYTPKRM